MSDSVAVSRERVLAVDVPRLLWVEVTQLHDSRVLGEGMARLWTVSHDVSRETL